MIKWKGYLAEASTWEPSAHIPPYVRNDFMNPPVSRERLECAALTFEYAIQQRLRSRNNRTIINFDLDIFRFCFGVDKCILLERSDLDKLPLSRHWYYNINRNGRGTQLSFPVKAEPRLWMRKTFVHNDNGKVILQPVPTERLVVTSALDGLVV